MYHHAPVCCCLWQPQVRKLYTVICAVIFGKQAVDAGGTAPRAGPSGPLVVSFATRMVYLYLRDALVRLSGAGPGRVADSPSEAAVPHRAVVRTLVSSPFMCRAPGVSCCFTPPPPSLRTSLRYVRIGIVGAVAVLRGLNAVSAYEAAVATSRTTIAAPAGGGGSGGSGGGAGAGGSSVSSSDDLEGDCPIVVRIPSSSAIISHQA